MLALTEDQQEALASRRVMRRHFIWIEGRDFDTGDPDPVGFWNDVGAIEHSGRIYYGSGNVIAIGSLGAKGDLSIPGLQITISGIAAESAALVRGRAISQAPVEVLIGIFDVDNHALISPLFALFTGKVDDATIHTPPVGGTSTIDLVCESTSRALTRQSTATRSLASSIERDEADEFYKYTGAQRLKPLYFGRKAPAEAAAGGRS